MRDDVVYNKWDNQVMVKKHLKRHLRCGIYMEKKVSNMKSDAVYNHWDNLVYVRTNGHTIHIICHKEEQQEKVIQKMTTDNCLLESYEVWEDEKTILTFRVLDNYEITPELN